MLPLAMLLVTHVKVKKSCRVFVVSRCFEIHCLSHVHFSLPFINQKTSEPNETVA